MMPGEQGTPPRVGARSGVRLTVDRSATVRAMVDVVQDGKTYVVPVEYRRLPYPEMRDMVLRAEREAAADGAKPSMARFMDAALLTSLISVDGVPFTAEILVQLDSAMAKSLNALIGTGQVASEGNSDSPSGETPAPEE